jgi:ribosomal protein S18 acetylase RimI-like enzyme
MQIEIRKIQKNEIHLLKHFLYDAIFQKDDTNPLPKDIIYEPKINIYIKDFGQKHDLCLVAIVEDNIVGAVWTRVFLKPNRGFGYVDDHTPELSISINKEYRNKGIGTKLMENMLFALKKDGYKQVSLSVQKENPAYRIYEKLGFRIVKEKEKDVTMAYRLNE